MKTTPILIEFTEKENGQLAKDLEIIIQKEVNFKSKKRKNTPKTPQ
jgi:hypothetical protein